MSDPSACISDALVESLGTPYLSGRSVEESLLAVFLPSIASKDTLRHFLGITGDVPSHENGIKTLFDRAFTNAIWDLSIKQNVHLLWVPTDIEEPAPMPTVLTALKLHVTTRCPNQAVVIPQTTLSTVEYRELTNLLTRSPSKAKRVLHWPSASANFDEMRNAIIDAASTDKILQNGDGNIKMQVRQRKKELACQTKRSEVLTKNRRAITKGRAVVDSVLNHRKDNTEQTATTTVLEPTLSQQHEEDHNGVQPMELEVAASSLAEHVAKAVEASFRALEDNAQCEKAAADLAHPIVGFIRMAFQSITLYSAAQTCEEDANDIPRKDYRSKLLKLACLPVDGLKQAHKEAKDKSALHHLAITCAGQTLLRFGISGYGVAAARLSSSAYDDVKSVLQLLTATLPPVLRAARHFFTDVIKVQFGKRFGPDLKRLAADLWEDDVEPDLLNLGTMQAVTAPITREGDAFHLEATGESPGDTRRTAAGSSGQAPSPSFGETGPAGGPLQAGRQCGPSASVLSGENSGITKTTNTGGTRSRAVTSHGMVPNFQHLKHRHNTLKQYKMQVPSRQQAAIMMARLKGRGAKSSLAVKTTATSKGAAFGARGQKAQAAAVSKVQATKKPTNSKKRPITSKHVPDTPLVVVAIDDKETAANGRSHAISPILRPLSSSMPDAIPATDEKTSAVPPEITRMFSGPRQLKFGDEGSNTVLPGAIVVPDSHMGHGPFATTQVVVDNEKSWLQNAAGSSQPKRVSLDMHMAHPAVAKKPAQPQMDQHTPVRNTKPLTVSQTPASNGRAALLAQFFPALGSCICFMLPGNKKPTVGTIEVYLDKNNRDNRWQASVSFGGRSEHVWLLKSMKCETSRDIKKMNQWMLLSASADTPPLGEKEEEGGGGDEVAEDRVAPSAAKTRNPSGVSNKMHIRKSKAPIAKLSELDRLKSQLAVLEEKPETPIGTRISIQRNGRWVQATVTAFNGRKHQVQFVNGKEELMLLAKEAFKVKNRHEQDEQSSGKEEEQMVITNYGEKRPATQSVQQPRTKRVRMTVHAAEMTDTISRGEDCEQIEVPKLGCNKCKRNAAGCSLCRKAAIKKLVRQGVDEQLLGMLGCDKGMCKKGGNGCKTCWPHVLYALNAQNRTIVASSKATAPKRKAEDDDNEIPKKSKNRAAEGSIILSNPLPGTLSKVVLSNNGGAIQAEPVDGDGKKQREGHSDDQAHPPPPAAAAAGNKEEVVGQLTGTPSPSNVPTKSRRRSRLGGMRGMLSSLKKKRSGRDQEVTSTQKPRSSTAPDKTSPYTDDFALRDGATDDGDEEAQGGRAPPEGEEGEEDVAHAVSGKVLAAELDAVADGGGDVSSEQEDAAVLELAASGKLLPQSQLATDDEESGQVSSPQHTAIADSLMDAAAAGEPHLGEDEITPREEQPTPESSPPEKEAKQMHVSPPAVSVRVDPPKVPCAGDEIMCVLEDFKDTVHCRIVDVAQGSGDSPQPMNASWRETEEGWKVELIVCPLNLKVRFLSEFTVELSRDCYCVDGCHMTQPLDWTFLNYAGPPPQERVAAAARMHGDRRQSVDSVLVLAKEQQNQGSTFVHSSPSPQHLLPMQLDMARPVPSTERRGKKCSDRSDGGIALITAETIKQPAISRPTADHTPSISPAAQVWAKQAMAGSATENILRLSMDRPFRPADPYDIFLQHDLGF